MKKEVKIALVAILGIVILFFGMNFLKGLHMFADSEIYYVSYGNVAGVEKNTPVYADGVRVGSVSDITYDYTHQTPTILSLALDGEMRVPAGSTAEVKSDLMGNTQVNLLLTTNLREKINPGDTIRGHEEDDVVGKLKAMVPAVERMGPKLDSILTSLNAILSNPAIQAILTNAQTVSSDLATSTKQLNTLLAQLNQNVPGMLDKANNVLDNTQTLTGNLAAVDVQATMNQVNQTLADVQKTIDNINSTKGTLGKLMNDPSLYNNLNTTMMHTDSLVIDLKSNPKRYVHFSVW